MFFRKKQTKAEKKLETYFQSAELESRIILSIISKAEKKKAWKQARKKYRALKRYALRLRLYAALQNIFVRLHLTAPPAVNYIGGSETLPPPLNHEEEEKAIIALTAGDEGAKRLLIEHNLRLVVYIARRFENTGVGLEDLISIGTIGLIKAINTFNSEKKIKLATYASRCVENEILMHLRKISTQKAEVSLDEPLNTDWDGNELLLSDILGSDGDEVSRPLEDDADKRMLLDAVFGLAERERDIIIMRFGLCGSSEYTQKEVADIMGISQSYISRLEKRIISRLKREIIRQTL